MRTLIIRRKMVYGKMGKEKQRVRWMDFWRMLSVTTARYASGRMA